MNDCELLLGLLKDVKWLHVGFSNSSVGLENPTWVWHRVKSPHNFFLWCLQV